MTSVSCIWFSFLLPNMKPRLGADARGILFRAAELKISGAGRQIHSPRAIGCAQESVVCSSRCARMPLERESGDMTIA
jgi:hypothetical protein